MPTTFAVVQLGNLLVKRDDLNVLSELANAGQAGTALPLDGTRSLFRLRRRPFAGVSDLGSAERLQEGMARRGTGGSGHAGR